MKNRKRKLGGFKMISEKIVEKLKESEEKATEEEKDKQPSSNLNRASEIGWVDECPRYLCLSRLCPEKRKPKDEKQLIRMREGKKQEPLMAADLAKAGFELQTKPRLVWPDLQLTGELDRLIKIDNKFYPIDFKTSSSAMFKHISRMQTAQDFLKSRFYWLRLYPGQLSIYMLMTHCRFSCLFTKDKESGLAHFVDIELDSQYTSRLLNGLRQVNEWVRAENPPKAEKIEICDSCDFADYDFPDTETTSKELEIITDEDWLIKAKEYEQLIKAGAQIQAKALEGLEKDMKEAFRGQRALIGNVLIESKPYLTTYFDVPAEEKAKYQKQRENFRASIKILADRF